MESNAKFLVTSAIKIDEQSGTADLFALVSDAAYPLEGTNVVNEWPITLSWSSGKIDDNQWEEWSLKSVRVSIVTIESEAATKALDIAMDIIERIQKAFSPEEIAKALFGDMKDSSFQYEEVIMDPRLGEYVQVNNLVDPSWDLYSGFFTQNGEKVIVGMAIALNAGEARQAIAVDMSGQKGNALKSWAAEAFPVDKQNAQTYRDPYWNLSLVEKAKLISVAEAHRV